MNRKVLYGFAVLVIAAIAAWNVNVTSKGSGMSDVMLSNVEALARNETQVICYSDPTYQRICNIYDRHWPCPCGW